MKIVVLDGFALNPGDLSWSSLEELGDVTVHDRTSRDEVIERAKEADIILINKISFKKEQFEQLPKLKYIGVLATGYNIVDVEEARRHGIVVTNVPTYGTQAVAQFVFAHLLEICHHIPLHAQSVKEGKWNRREDFCYWEKPLIELSGKVMGIIGAGRIGMETAKIANAFGMRVIVFTPRPDLSRETPMLKFVSFDTLVKDSDIISLHCPLTPETRGIINAEAISKMKSGVIIINTSRGPLIDEVALLEGLKSGKIYAAGLDVLAKEPPSEHNPLFDQENCNVTPHIAWAPHESRKRLLDTAVENVKMYMNGEPINQVNGG
ncbi:MAG: D-2-hydroxyacid dehydrogenase [Clostridia bacterium]|nr:D-2-hydroxyacid dehydrogenase [Clostridia bacterium]